MKNTRVACKDCPHSCPACGNPGTYYNHSPLGISVTFKCHTVRCDSYKNGFYIYSHKTEQMYVDHD